MTHSPHSSTINNSVDEKKSINGRYILHDEIGRGGMGIVHRATDRLTGKIVALKQITALASDGIEASVMVDHTFANLRLSLAQEFEILAGLRHPHIITVLDYGFDHDKKPYFAMNYLQQAETLLTAATPLNTLQKIDFIGQLLQALAYLHRHGILHKDIKPSNTVVANNHLYLLDFGLSATQKQHSAMDGGTLLYMAPETYHQTKPYSPASDLYSVGITMFQLIAGVHPFSQLVSDSDLDSPIDAVYNIEALGLSSEVANVLHTLLQKDPNKRYRNGGTALIALNQALGHDLPESREIRESFLQAAAFVGRHKELFQLTTALTDAKNGIGSAWLLGGESGVGKSRLLAELRTQALVKGFLVLSGQAKREKGGSSYQLWREPLRQAVVAVPEVDDLIASVLLPLIPDIAQLLGRTIYPAPELSGQATQLRLLTTITTLLQKSASPILLILEDLHWGDQGLQLIQSLSEGIKCQDILMIGSYRNDERPSLPDTLPHMEAVTLNRLTADMVTELSVAMLGEVGKQPEVVALIQRETEGNAFFAVEVVRTLAEEVGRLSDVGQMVLPKRLLPNGIQDVVKRRVGRLPQAAQELLNIAAVVGREIDLPIMESLANGIDIENKWLPLCAEAAVLDIAQERWRFNHDKIREGLLVQLDEPTLLIHHTKVATSIEALYPDAPEQAARLTYHWQQANNPEKEGIYAFMAGKHAVSQYSLEDAITFFTQALDNTPVDQAKMRYEILLARESVYEKSGSDRGKQEEDLAMLADLASRLNDPKKQAVVALQQTIFLFSTSQLEKTITAAQSTIKWGELVGDENLVMECHRIWSGAAFFTSKIDVAQEHLEYCIQGFRRLGNLAKLSAALNGFGVLNQMRDTKKGLAALEEALELAQQINDLDLQGTVYHNLSNYMENMGDYRQAINYGRQTLALSQKIYSLPGEAYAYQSLSKKMYILGDYEKAVDYIEKSLALHRNGQNMRAENGVLITWLNVAERTGKFTQPKIAVEESIEIARTQNLKIELGHRLMCLGSIYHHQQKFDKADVAFVEAYPLLEAINDTAAMAVIRFRQAQQLQEQQQWEAATDYYLKTIDLSDQDDSMNPQQLQSVICLAHIGLAQIQSVQRDIETAVTHVEPAVNYIQNQSLMDGWADMWMASQCYQILRSAHDLRASEVLQKAYQILQQRTAWIEDESAQRFNLEQVAEHREIVRFYEELEKLGGSTLIVEK